MMLQGRLERTSSHVDLMQVLGAHNMLAGSLPVLAILFVCTGFSGTAEGKSKKPSKHIHEYIYLYIYICTHMYKFASPPLPPSPFSTGCPPFPASYHPLTSPLYVFLSLLLSPLSVTDAPSPSTSLSLSTIYLPASLLAADNHVVGEDRHPPVPSFRRGPRLQRPLRLLLPRVLPESPVRKSHRLRHDGDPHHLPGTVS
jgi:hypothetical protein